MHAYHTQTHYIKRFYKQSFQERMLMYSTCKTEVKIRIVHGEIKLVSL